MADLDTLLDKVTVEYANLSPQLQRAAKIVLETPSDVAMYSMRKLAARVGVVPNTFLRLARTLGYEDYSAFRSDFQSAIGHGNIGFSDKAKTLATGDSGSSNLLYSMATATSENTTSVFEVNSSETFQTSADLIRNARRVFVLGSGCYAVANHMAYLANMALKDVRLTGSSVVTAVNDLIDAQPEDIAIGITCKPYSAETMRAAQIVIDQKAKLVVIADSRTAPLAALADQVIVAPSASPMFYPSIAAAITVVEVLMALIVSGADKSVINRIGRLDAYRQVHSVYWNNNSG